MTALPVTRDDVPAVRTVARSSRPQRGTVAAPLRLAAPPRPVAAPNPGAGPGWDMVPVDPRVRQDVERWVQRYAQASLEIVAGERPASQLTRWTRTRVHQDLVRRAHLALRATGRVDPGAARTAAGHPRAQIHSSRLSFLSSEQVEAAFVVRHGERCRALAARFEWLRGRWVCTALEFC